MLYNQLQHFALQTVRADNLRLCDIGMGLHFTFATVSDGNMTATGVALTPSAEGSVGGMDTVDILKVLEESLSYDSGKRSFGLAVINAVSQYKLMQNPPILFEDLRQQLTQFILQKTTPSSKIVFIGHLQPVVKALKAAGRNPVVFCRQHSDPANGIYSDIYEYDAMRDADIVVITGAALIGSTVDALLHFAKDVPIKIMAGFSAGVFPAWFHESGITHVASIYLENVKLASLLQHNFEHIFTYPCYIETVS